jgi:hypothetical protein
MTAYVVTAGYVTVQTERPGGGRAAIDIPRGQTLPADVPQEQIDWELRLRTIEPVSKPKKAQAPTPAAEPDPEVDPDPLPLGMSVSSTQAWVGGDLARATKALAAEKASASPRATLIDRLGKLLPAE